MFTSLNPKFKKNLIEASLFSITSALMNFISGSLVIFSIENSSALQPTPVRLFSSFAIIREKITIWLFSYLHFTNPMSSQSCVMINHWSPLSRHSAMYDFCCLSFYRSQRWYHRAEFWILSPPKDLSCTSASGENFLKLMSTKIRNAAPTTILWIAIFWQLSQNINCAHFCKSEQYCWQILEWKCHTRADICWACLFWVEVGQISFAALSTLM